jgi:hypothetical protein
MGKLDALKQWVARYNENVGNLALKATVPALRVYLKSHRVKGLDCVDQKAFIDWLQSSEYPKSMQNQRRGFEYYNYKVDVSLHEKDFLDNMDRLNEGYRFLAAIAKKGSDQMDHWYVKFVKKHKNFFTTDILLKEFLDLPISPNQSEHDQFAVVKPFLEKYGTFNHGPETFNSYWDSMSYVERFRLEWYTIKHLLSVKRKYGSAKFSKSVSQEPQTKKEERYWAWYNEFARYLYELPHDRRLEYFAARPIRRMASSSRERAQTKYIEDFFPYSINLLYKYIFGDEIGEWQTCQICGKYFEKLRNDQKCCCPQHSKMARNRKSKHKKEAKTE